MHLIDKEPVERHPSHKPDFHPTNGREGENATFLSRCLLNLELCGGGFAPRHLRRQEQ